ncbi:unnamed protein product [Prorocentrum cordatum]|uniref:Uncharacterized protein n=1 Tax=Prorocentrum cordatum TaxID=2364126 RepID=A0ABN9WMJ1_9DINO|nr:unnamed protein product [Polarella glacialis]
METTQVSAACTGDLPLPGQCPAVTLYVDWASWGLFHIVWPFAVQMILSILFLVLLHPAYVAAFYRNQNFQRRAKTYFGTSDRPKVARPLGLVVFSTVQVFSSLAAVGIWVFHTYRRKTSRVTNSVLLALAFVDVACWITGRVSRSCELSSLWELNAIVDVSTCTPVFARALGLLSGYDDWLSLHFLRSFSALNSFERARRIAQLDVHTAGLAQVRVQLALRVVSLLTVMAGTIFTFEVLGDPHWLRDSFVETESGDSVSFVQMVYWIVVSITTVGYGDFAPRTVLTRVMTTVFIVVGVASIYIIQFTFTELMRRQHEGTGRYWHRSWGQRRHVVVILNHKGEASRAAPLIHGLLQELMHASHNQAEDYHDLASSAWSHFRRWCQSGISKPKKNWPDVVIFSPTKWEPENSDDSTFQKFLEMTEEFPRNVRSRVWFLVGDATSRSDLDRARVRDSALTYMLSDIRSLAPDRDDAQTIHAAVVLRDFYPDVRLRLMVNKPESKVLALQAGFETTRCISTRELAASMMAQNARCQGLLPAVAALMKSVDADDEEFFVRRAAEQFLQHAGPAGAAPAGAGWPGEGAGGTWTGRGSKRTSAGSMASISNCKNMDEINKVLRKSQTQWSSRTQSYEYTDPWLFEYLEGTAHAAFGFDLHQKFEGVGFGALVISVYGETGAIVLGVQAKGRVVLCPQAKGWRARAGMVCFAIARSSSSLDPVRLSRDDRTSWRNTFQVSRRLRRAQGVRRGRHLDAAEMIGLSLRRALMPPQGAGAGEGSLAGPDTPKYPSATWQPTIDTSLEITRDVSRELSSPTRRRRSFGRAEVAPPLQPSAPAEMQGAEAARALRESLQPGEDLMMLVVCEGGSWQMVRTFLRTLRQDHLPVIQPVVVLAPARAPPGLLEDYGFRVACMQGSCLQAQALVEAGLLEASTVVVLAGEPAEHSRLSDHNLILCAQVLDFWLGAFPNRVFVSFELRDSASARHLPKLRGKTVSEDRSDLHQWAMTGVEGSHWRGGEPLSPVGVINRRRSAGSLGITSSFTKHGEPAGDALAISRFTSGESARPLALDAETASASDPLSPTRSCSAPLPTRRHSFLPFSLDVDAQEEIEMPMWLSDDDPDNGILEADSDNDEQLGAGIEDEGHRQRSPWDTLLESSGRSAVAEERSHESIMFHPRFAAGQIFTPELWGPRGIRLRSYRLRPSGAAGATWRGEPAVPSTAMARIARRSLRLREVPLFSLRGGMPRGDGGETALNLFEPRYVELARRANPSTSRGQFGYTDVAQRRKGGSGVLVKIDESGMRWASKEGPVSVFGRGQRRFRVLSLAAEQVGDGSTAPLHVACVQLLHDRDLARFPASFVGLAEEPCQEPPETIFGQVYTEEQGGWGYASYHFEEGGAYISYESALCSNFPALDDGSMPPARKYFCEGATFDLASRTFRGSVSWHPTTWQGDERWEYEMVFSSDLEAIVGGSVHRIAKDGGEVGHPRQDRFGVNLCYRRARVGLDGSDAAVREALLRSGLSPADAEASLAASSSGSSARAPAAAPPPRAAAAAAPVRAGMRQRRRLRHASRAALAKAGGEVVRLGAVRALAGLAAPPGPVLEAEDALHALLRRLSGEEGSLEVQLAAEGALLSCWAQSGDAQVDAELRRGAAHLEDQRLPEAVAAFTRVTEAAPGFAEGWNKRATALCVQGEYSRAIADCERVLALKPRHFGCLTGLGVCHLGLGNRPEALRWLRAALDVYPGMRGARDMLEQAELEDIMEKHLQPRMDAIVGEFKSGSSAPPRLDSSCSWDVHRVKVEDPDDDQAAWAYFFRMQIRAPPGSDRPVQSRARFYVLQVAGGGVVAFARPTQGKDRVSIAPGGEHRFCWSLVLSCELRGAVAGTLLEHRGAARGGARFTLEELPQLLPLGAPEADRDSLRGLSEGYAYTGQLDLRGAEFAEQTAVDSANADGGR